MNRGVEPAPAAVLVVNVYRPGLSQPVSGSSHLARHPPTGVSWWHPTLAICRPRILASVALAHTVVAGYGTKEWHGDHQV
jgi:hypothetical protein